MTEGQVPSTDLPASYREGPPGSGSLRPDGNGPEGQELQWLQSLPAAAPSLDDLLDGSSPQVGPDGPLPGSDGTGLGADDGPGCIETHRDGCLSPDAFRDLRDRVADQIAQRPEFRSEGQWGLEWIGVDKAHATIALIKGSHVSPGQGAIVGVVDSGIDLAHPAFQSGDRWVGETHYYGDEETGEVASHGTSVASVIAGSPAPGADVQHTGVAPGAAIEMTAVPTRSPPGSDVPYSPFRLGPGDSSVAGLCEYVLSPGPDVVNLSLEAEGLIENYEEADLRDAFAKTIDCIAQDDRTDQDKTIFVWAAGNSHGHVCRPDTSNCVGDQERDSSGRPAGRLEASSPSLFAGLSSRIEEIQGHSVAVVALGTDGEIADFSNRCGIAKERCIAVPGEGVQVAYFGPVDGQVVRDYVDRAGTSFAAPGVAGGLALMKQMFGDRLTNTQLVERLLETADRSGVYADSDVYGRGVMDLGAALMPLSAAEPASRLPNGAPAPARAAGIDASVGPGGTPASRVASPVVPEEGGAASFIARRPEVEPPQSRSGSEAVQEPAPSSANEGGRSRFGSALSTGRGYLQQAASSLRERFGSSGGLPDRFDEGATQRRDSMSRESRVATRFGVRDVDLHGRGAGGIGVRRTGPAKGIASGQPDPVPDRVPSRAGGMGR